MRTLLALFIVATLFTGCTGSALEGTWMLTSRELPDGRVQTAPDVLGCLMYANGTRNFNVYWEDEQGQPISLAAIAEYRLTDDAYWERNIYYRASGFGQGVQYDLSNDTGTASVVRTDGRLEFDLPLHDEPSVVFEGDTFTAIVEGAFVDHWQRID